MLQIVDGIPDPFGIKVPTVPFQPLFKRLPNFVPILQGVPTPCSKQMQPATPRVLQRSHKLSDREPGLDDDLSQQIRILPALRFIPLCPSICRISLYLFCFCLTCISSMQIALVRVSLENSSCTVSCPCNGSRNNAPLTTSARARFKGLAISSFHCDRAATESSMSSGRISGNSD